MATSALNDIESQFAQLSPEAQLSLLERLVHRVRDGLAGNQDNWETALSAMAADPEMQKEISQINTDFAFTEADGLEKD